MAEPPKNRPQSEPSAPPRLERVVPGGDAPRPAAAPRAVTPGASHGLAAPEVTAGAAVAAGLAHQGTLEHDSGLHLLALAASTQATGRLTLSPPGRTTVLAFRKGVLEHAASSLAEDDLAHYLLARQVITAAQAQQAEGAAASMGGVAAALVTLKLVNPGDLVRHLQDQAAQLVARALVAEAGGWRWEPGVAPPPGSFPLASPWVLLGLAVRALDAEAVRRRLGAREQLGASRIAGRVRPEDLRLTPQETHAAARLDGRALSEVARAHPAEASTILRVALLLAEADLLTFSPPRSGAAGPAAAPEPTAHATPVPPQAPAAAPAAAIPKAVAPPAPAPPAAAPRPASPPPAAPRPAVTPAPASAQAAPRPAPAAPRPAAAAAPPVAPAARPPAPRPPASASAGPAVTPAPVLPATLAPATLKALLASYSAKDADHFTVLGVKRDATGAQVKLAYFQLAKAYHPDTVPTAAPAEVKKLCADVFTRIGEAWGVLGDDARRARYLDDLKTGAGVDVDVMNILQAENVFQAGTLFVKARRYDEAIPKFEEAMKLNPDEPEFGMWKAWCEFLLAQDKKKFHPGAAGTIEAGLRKNPRCAQGYLFLGQMAKLLGDLALAEKQLKRGLAVAPEHTDLVRELKYLRK